MAFTEPDILAKFDRSYGDKKEELRLERGEYNGKPTYTLRLYWQADDGSWRWAAQKPTQSGKCWERLNLKQREMAELGEALSAVANGTIRPLSVTPARRREPALTPIAAAFAEVADDDIPF